MPSVENWRSRRESLDDTVMSNEDWKAKQHLARLVTERDEPQSNGWARL